MKTPIKEDALTRRAAGPAKKSVEMPIGVPGYTLTTEARQVPLQRVWPINKDLKYVGQSFPRYTGAPRPPAAPATPPMCSCPGILYAKFVNATVLHAKLLLRRYIRGGEGAARVKGVHVIQRVMGGNGCVITYNNVPQFNYAGQHYDAAIAGSGMWVAWDENNGVQIHITRFIFHCKGSGNNLNWMGSRMIDFTMILGVE